MQLSRSMFLMEFEPELLRKWSFAQYDSNCRINYSRRTLRSSESARSSNDLPHLVGLACRLRIPQRERLFLPFAMRQQKDIAMQALNGAVAERPFARRWLAATAGLALGLVGTLPAQAQDTIKIGILHSLSGTMAISETTLKDVMLMLIDEQ